MKEVKTINNAIEDSVIDLTISFMEKDGRLNVTEMKKMKDYIAYCNRLLSIAEANQEMTLLRIEYGFMKEGV